MPGCERKHGATAWLLPVMWPQLKKSSATEWFHFSAIPLHEGVTTLSLHVTMAWMSWAPGIVPRLNAGWDYWVSWSSWCCPSPGLQAGVAELLALLTRRVSPKTACLYLNWSCVAKRDLFLPAGVDLTTHQELEPSSGGWRRRGRHLGAPCLSTTSCC